VRLRAPRRLRKTSPALVEFGTATNDRGYVQDCVYATCRKGSGEVGPIWGSSEASVLRALATLTEKCNCGAQFHRSED